MMLRGRAIVFLLAAGLSVRAEAWQGGWTTAAGSGAARRVGFDFDPRTPLADRVRTASATVLRLFHMPGKSAPVSHRLDARETQFLLQAVESLTPLHRRVMNERLYALYFVDNMPNTALTFPEPGDPSKRLLSIAIRASAMNNSIAEWLTEKEISCFAPAAAPFHIAITCGDKMNALSYVLLHEATHVVDHVERQSSEGPADKKTPAVKNPFTDGVWLDRLHPVKQFNFPLREVVGFYREGQTVKLDEAPAIYAALAKTPFVSLYGSRNWFDDLAEYTAIYHLGEVLHLPYRLTVYRGDSPAQIFEPMQNPLVRDRMPLMKRFYIAN